MRYWLFLLVAIWAMIILCEGCASTANKSPAAIVAPTGTAINQASAYTDSAESAVQAAVPHADAAGQADLGLASSAHKSVKTSLGSALADLNIVQAALTAEQAQVSSLTNQVTTLTNSWGHKLQVWVTLLFWVLVVLVAVHFVFGALAIFVPTYAPVFALISKIVNPLGWFTWLVSAMAPAAQAVVKAA
jgi:ABC-type multidrug transport system fused ATPase/permease subunit